MSNGLLPALGIKRVDRLIAGAVLGGLLLAWLVLTGLDTFLQLASQIGKVGHDYPLASAVGYVLWTVPRRAFQWFVFAALIGSLIGIGSLAASGELTALRAAGMSKWRIGLSVAGLVAVLLVGVMAIGEIIAPAGEQQAQAIQSQRRAGQLRMQTAGGLWMRDGNTIVNARAALSHLVNGQAQIELADVRLFGFDASGQLTSLRIARLATRKDHAWVLHDVRESRVAGDQILSSTRARADWHTSLDPDLLQDSVISPDYLSLRDLSRNIEWLRGNHQNPGVYLNAYWTRVFYPVTALLLVLCALPFGFGALRSGGLGKRLFLGVLLAIAWFFIQRAIISTGIVLGAPPLLTNLVPALLLVAITAWYYRRA